MSSNPPSGKASFPTTKPSETSGESTSTRTGPQQGSADGLGEVMGQFSRDVGSLKDTFTRLASQLGDVGTKTARNVSQTVASQIGSATSGVVAWWIRGPTLRRRRGSTPRHSPPNSKAWRGATPWAQLQARWWSV